MAVSFKSIKSSNYESPVTGGAAPRVGGSNGFFALAREWCGLAACQSSMLEFSAVVLVVALSLMLRISGESFPASTLVGAYAGRSTIFCFIFLVVGLFFGVGKGLLLSRWPVSWLAYIRKWAFFGIIFNVVGTLALSTTLDSEINARIM